MMLQALTDACGAQVLQGFRVPRRLFSYDTEAERLGGEVVLVRAIEHEMCYTSLSLAA